MQYIQDYSEYVRENAQLVKKIEERARFGTILLPKGNLGEVATEGSYAILGLIGVINDAIIHGKTRGAGEVWSFAGGDKQYQEKVTFIRGLLTFFAHCEALLEVSATKWTSVEFRDRLVETIEIVKAIARLILLSWFPRECIYAGGKFESHIPATNTNNTAAVAAAAGSATSTAATTATPTTTSNSTTSWVGRRSGLSLRVPQTMQKFLDQTGQTENMKRDTQIRIFGELLHILRPVLYVIFSRRFKNQWWPFLLSLSMDLISLRLFHKVSKLKLSSIISITQGSHEELELRRRTFLLFFYLFRTPLYEKTLGSFSSSLVDTFKDVPLMSTLAELVAFQLDFYHLTHFYSAAS